MDTLKELIIEMNSLLIQALFRFLEDKTVFGLVLTQVADRLVTPELKNAILHSVEMLMSAQLEGEKKREMVKKGLLEAQGAVGESARELAGWVVDTVIQQTFLVVASRAEKPRKI